MADQTQEQKDQLNKEQAIDARGAETPEGQESAPEISPAEIGRVKSLEQAGNLRQKIEKKPSGGAQASAPAKQKNAGLKDESPKIKALKKLRQADPKKFAEKLDAAIKREIGKDQFQQADDDHDQTITNFSLK